MSPNAYPHLEADEWFAPLYDFQAGGRDFGAFDDFSAGAKLPSKRSTAKKTKKTPTKTPTKKTKKPKKSPPQIGAVKRPTKSGATRIRGCKDGKRKQTVTAKGGRDEGKKRCKIYPPPEKKKSAKKKGTSAKKQKPIKMMTHIAAGAKKSKKSKKSKKKKSKKSSRW